MNYSRRALYYFFFILFVSSCSGWEWQDFVSGGDGSSLSSGETLTMSEVSGMRVRDIKRRLTRNHGYSAEEIGKMIDKKELIQALSFEEYKLREVELTNLKRSLLKRGVLAALAAVALVMFWPLLRHVWEVASVNFVVYTDRKRHEARRCWELRSVLGFFGVALMLAVDLLQVWLSTSILLSWVTTSRYFFPTPSIPIRPAQFMNPGIANGPLGGYGFNVGPMIVSWLLRFTNRKLESWTGRQLSKAQTRQKQANKKKKREGETPEEREARRAARRAARAARKAAAADDAAASSENNNNGQALNNNKPSSSSDDDIWQQQQKDFQLDETTYQNNHSVPTDRDDDNDDDGDARNHSYAAPSGPSCGGCCGSNGGKNNDFDPNQQSPWVDEILNYQEEEDDQQEEVVTTVLDDLD